MTWKLDDIDLKSYGVGVQRSAGLLDMPRLVDEANDWPDLNSVDYWQNSADARYGEREIALYCWIKGASYLDYKGKVAAFYAAITAPGTRTLKYNDITIETVSVQQQVEMVRKTSYINSIQIGLFTLRLTVTGDGNYKLLNIYGYSIAELRATVKTSNLQISKTLLGDKYATCTFESNTKLDIRYFDFIQITYDNTGFDRFILYSEPSFVKKGTNKYVYNLRFDHSSNFLANTQFLSVTGESDFYFYGNLEDILDLIISNQTRTFNLFHKGTVPATINKNHKFSGEDCLTVLRRMCVEYELEYAFDYIVPGYYFVINIAALVGNTKEITLEYGKGKGQYELARGARNEDEFFTVLYAYGAAKNLPAGYRDGMTRLGFDLNPLEQNLANGRKERTIFFEDIFPQRTANVTGYLEIIEPALSNPANAAMKEVYPGGVYRVTDSTIDFDVNNYLLGGLMAKMRMKTGDLAGYEFEIYKFDFLNKYFYLIPYKDDRGRIWPNADFTITPAEGLYEGDEYTLVDIDQPATYVTAAENALQASAIEKLAVGSVPQFQYTAKIDPAFTAANSIGFEEGDRLTLVDTDYGIDGLFRISSLNYNFLTKVWDLTFSDNAKPSRLKLIETKLDKQDRTNQDSHADTIEQLRNDRQSTGELRRKILDPYDEKLNADNIVRNNSIDPGMIAHDLALPTLRLDGGWLNLNVDEDEDKIHVEAGTLTLTNFNTLSRYDIKVNKDLAISYDPRRTWIIEATDFTLPNKNKHWLYARLNIASGSTECTLLVTELHIETKRDIDDGYLYYLLNPITAGEL